ECWWNFDTLPDINEDYPDFCRFINGKNGIISKWIKNGARGWRLDVADELPDSFLEALRKAAKGASKDALIIGEVWEDASNKISYDKRRKYFQGKQLDAVMNYPLKNAIIDYVRYGNAHGLAVTMRELCDNYPKDTLNCLMNILGTHDTPRIVTALAGRIIESNDRERKAGTRLSDSEWKLGVHRLKIASLLQYTLPGVPCVYYGDEAGMEGYNDPFNRKTYPWGKENGDLISWYTFLGSVRKASPLFKDGIYKNICHENGVFAFSRENGNEKLIVCVNLSDKDYNLHLDSIYYDLNRNEVYKGDLTVSPQFYYILKKV
ncbi:MAG: glycoside hydrolase family 13 protein, partial [Clostridia bacterium]|nr:glycoside hydrolase family 13 protein [Clostridia bacterium]